VADKVPRGPRPNATTSPYDGSDRRVAESPDRRAKPRGGRRATDAFRRAADFVYKLLTEPPR
jgi:hypothetical protein